MIQATQASQGLHQPPGHPPRARRLGCTLCNALAFCTRCTCAWRDSVAVTGARAGGKGEERRRSMDALHAVGKCTDMTWHTQTNRATAPTGGCHTYDVQDVHVVLCCLPFDPFVCNQAGPIQLPLFLPCPLCVRCAAVLARCCPWGAVCGLCGARFALRACAVRAVRAVRAKTPGSIDPMRFERTRGNPTALAGPRLDHSATGAERETTLLVHDSCGPHETQRPCPVHLQAGKAPGRRGAAAAWWPDPRPSQTQPSRCRGAGPGLRPHTGTPAHVGKQTHPYR